MLYNIHNTHINFAGLDEKTTMLLTRLQQTAKKPCPYKGSETDDYEEGYYDGYSNIQQTLHEILYLYTVDAALENQ